MPLSNLQTIGKHGVLTLYGFGIKVRVDRGHLSAEWGIGPDRHSVRLPRVGHGLKRVVMLGSDGFISLAALRWISDIGTSFSMLDKRGKVIVVCGPCAPSDARLRRAQALSVSNGVGLEICRTLICAKLEGQERVVREQLKDNATGDVIAKFREERLPVAENIEA